MKKEIKKEIKKEKIKIYFDKNTNNFAGAGNISSKFKDSKDLNFIEIEEKEWLNFLNLNQGKIIKIVDKKLTAEEITESFEQKKQRLINIRKKYLQDTDWYILREFDKSNTYPKEIKSKRILARQEINKIETANKKDINNYLTEF